MIVLENRGGKMGYRIETDVQETVIDPPELNGPELNGAGIVIKDAIVKALIARGGLYPKEAQAMMDTWQDSWFEEGMRVIYILPQRQVDAVLPLIIQPAPAETTRAFVGRIEMLSPGMKQNMENAMASGDTATLEKFGRFLGAFAAPRRRRVQRDLSQGRGEPPEQVECWCLRPLTCGVNSASETARRPPRRIAASFRRRPRGPGEP